MARQYLYNTTDVIKMLNSLLTDNSLKRPFPKFSKKEIDFIIKIIFYKSKGAFFKYLLDNFIENNVDLLYLSPADLRKLAFINHLFEPPFNSARAARLAGFSEKSAKQQACRLIKEIRKKMSE